MKRRLLTIIIAFCISFLFMVGFSLYSLDRINTYNNYSDLLDHSSTVIDNIYQAELHLRDIDRAERGYMVTRDTMYLRFLNNAIDSINADLADIKQLTADNKGQLNNVALLKGAVALRISKARENISYFDTAKNYTLSTYKDSRKLMQDCSKKLKEIHTAENKLRDERFKGEHTYFNITAVSIRYLLIVFFIITTVIFVFLIKELRSRVRYQEELQARVLDLRRSHSELQEIAYVASHDLQEPLRKIQVFSNMLLFQETTVLEDEVRIKLERINNSANRMQSLITDLMGLTNLTKIDENKKTVDLNKIVKFIATGMQGQVGAQQAILNIHQLPLINGYDNQLRLLFRSLLDNALKFTRPGVPPVITITSDVVLGHELSDLNPNLFSRKFHRITISDNGIGFDNQFIDKIFGIFKRLHAQSEYTGKGIGLAICQRIIANHEGYIMASGEVNLGASFRLFFPIDK